MSWLEWKGAYAYVDQWTLMKTPYPFIATALLYLWAVFVWAPNFMKNRKAFDLKRIILYYNIWQVLACAAIVLYVPGTLLPLSYGWVCDEADRGSYEHIPDVQKFWFWGNMAVLFLRTSEYLETVWFILRKKQGQVTVLHVFHHIAVTFLLWIFGKYGLERNGGFVIVVNSLVHVIMYGYYIVSSIESTRKRAMKYKSHMTIFQIIQLIVLFGHSIRMIVACNAPLYYRLLAPSVGILIVLFTNFYVRTYVLKRKVKSN